MFDVRRRCKKCCGIKHSDSGSLPLPLRRKKEHAYPQLTKERKGRSAVEYDLAICSDETEDYFKGTLS
jgi:hypothetical protein